MPSTAEGLAGLKPVLPDGSSLVFGHPQGPTAGRCIIELIEELKLKGGSYGMFTGCAAGDTAAVLVFKVA